MLQSLRTVPCDTGMAALQGVRLMDMSGLPALPEEARRPCTTAGIWHLMYDAELRIADVWFLRELAADEFYRKVRGHFLAGWHLAMSWQPSTGMQQRKSALFSSGLSRCLFLVRGFAA